MNKANKAGSQAIVGDGKNGSSTRAAVAGLAVLLTFLVGTARNSAARRDPASRSADLKMSVRVYDYAKCSANMLRLAESETERVFARAGVRVEWHECTSTARGESADSTCAAPVTPSELQLRIVKRVKLMPIYASAECAGFTIGDLATVQLDPLLELRTPTECSPALMLGRAIAHEFGHALLGAGHSSRGIMQALWDEDKVGVAAANVMIFTSDQERALRLAVKTRNGQETVTESGLRTPRVRNW